MPPPLPPQEVTRQFMQFIAEKAKNVTSPMNAAELCRQFKEEIGTSLSTPTLQEKIHTSRSRIHEMDEFDMETKVKMLFALATPIDKGFLIEMKKVAEVEVDGDQRITKYKQKDGKLELTASNLRLPMDQREDRNKSILQLLAEKTKTVNTPIAETLFLREIKKKTGCPDSRRSLSMRYLRVKKTIFNSSQFDKNTKIKMMFISNTQLSDDILEKLRQDADVEVDNRGRMTKYKSNDGSLELEGSRERPNTHFQLARWQKICEKVNNDESEEDDDEGSYDKQQTDLMKFLIEKTKNATSPLRIRNLSKNFKREFKVSGPWTRINARIRSIRPLIFNMNEFDIDTKVKMLFVLSARIDDNLLEELQKGAIVELDHKQRIAKYEANDGSLKLEGVHSKPAKAKATLTNINKAKVVDDSSDSDGDEEKKNNRKRGRKSDQTATSSSSVRRSERIKNGMSGGRKRARYPYSSSEESEDKSSEEEEESDKKSMTNEDDAPMDSDNSRVDNGGDDFDYDPPSVHQDNGDGIDYDRPIHNKENMKHVLAEPNSEVTEAQKEEAGSSSSVKIETMSLLDLLTHLRTPTVQYAPSLVQKLDDKIKELEKKDKQTPFNIIIDSLEMCIQILNNPDEMDSDENTTSLSDFFYHLGMALLDIPHSSMDDFHVKMRKLATTGNKQIPMEQIRYAMTETLDKLIR